MSERNLWAARAELVAILAGGMPTSEVDERAKRALAAIDACLERYLDRPDAGDDEEDEADDPEYATPPVCDVCGTVIDHGLMLVGGKTPVCSQHCWDVLLGKYGQKV
jgi:hypothetical protein